jgi:hypothetical protein
LVVLLLEMEQLPEDIEWEDERTIATLKVMEFLKRAQHPEPYITYVHELSKQHLSSNRMVEAGLTLLLHANLLQWSDKPLKALLHFPEQSERRRKEQLYLKAIKYFDRAKDWERGVVLLKELCEQYESVTPGFLMLSSLLIRQAKFFENIASIERYTPEYFRVCFYGKGFPPSLKVCKFGISAFNIHCPYLSVYGERTKNSFTEDLSVNALLLSFQECQPGILMQKS